MGAWAGTTSPRGCAGPRSPTSRRHVAAALASGHRRAPGSAAGRRGERRRRRAADRAHRPREALRLRAARRLPDHRGVPARPALRPAPVYLENQFLWSPEVVNSSPTSSAGRRPTSFASSSCCPARRTTERTTRAGNSPPRRRRRRPRALPATTIRARSGNTSDRVYVHAKVGIVDDRWLTLGSANLNAHSFFNDTEVNVVTCDAGARARHTTATVGRPSRTRHRRGRRRPEHASSTSSGARSRPSSASAGNRGEPLTHGLVELQATSRRSERLLGPLQALLVDG